MRTCFKLLVILLGVVSCGVVKTEENLGTEDHLIQFYFVPSRDTASLRTNAKKLLEYLATESDLHFEKPQIPKSYEPVVEAFGKEEADVAMINSLGYVMAHVKYGARAKLRVNRIGNTSYRGQIITNVNSDVEKIKDLNGKTFAFTDQSSTSGYLFPQRMLLDQNVRIKQKIFALSHDKVVESVYHGTAQAGATYYIEPGPNGEIRDARSLLLDRYPDIAQKVVIIALTDPIPNDPLAFRKEVRSEIVDRITAALLKYSLTNEGKKVLYDLYSIEGFTEASDDDYVGLKEAYQIINQDPASYM